MNDPAINRRDFLISAGVATAGMMVSACTQTTTNQPSPAPGMALATGNKTLDHIFDRPMRWAQLVLVDNDPGNYDPQFWIDYFRRTKCQGVNLSAGGCVAFYPTAIPYHYKSAWMKDGMDPFGELVAACRKMDMTIIARTDPHSIRDDAAAAHPEWIAVDGSGNKRRHWAAPNRWVTCGLGPYNFDFMTDVHKEITQKYDIDAIFANRWQGSGLCYCDSCKKLFRDFAGMDLPRVNDLRDAAYIKYQEWQQARLFELWRHWQGTMRATRPTSAFVGNSGGGSTSTLDMVTMAELAPLIAADRQSRRGVMPIWANGKNGKEYRATYGNKAILGIAALGIDDDHRWKDSVINAAELRLWIVDGLANGLRPWFVKFGGVIYDKRWIPVIENLWTWHARHEKYMRNTQNLARVAMVYSQQTGTYYGGAAKVDKVENHELGFYQALIESRIPFEMVHDQLLAPENIDRFKLLILPNTAALSDQQCNQLRAYVHRGGNLLATYETSLYDQSGKRRPDFGLADLFGVNYAGSVQTNVRNSYMNVEAQTKSPLLRGLEDAGRIINTVSYVDVKSATIPGLTALATPLTRVPSYPDLPMEEVYPRTPHTDIPEVHLRQLGYSRIAYFPGDISRTFWEVLAVDHLLLLRNAIEWATNEPRPVDVTGPGMLDITFWQQESSLTAFLVNLTNPMMLKPAIREVMPLPKQQVSVQLPPGRSARAVKLLVNGQSPSFRQSGRRLTLTVDSVADFEVVAIDL